MTLHWARQQVHISFTTRRVIQNIGRMGKQNCIGSVGNQALAFAFETAVTDENNNVSTLVVKKVKY